MRAPLTDSALLLGGAEATAGARISALREIIVGRRGGLSDLGTRAEARIHVSGFLEAMDRSVEDREALRLVQNRAIPVEAQRPQIGDLSCLEPGLRALRVEILDPQEEGGGPRAGEKPGRQCGPQAAQMERAGGGGSESARGAQTSAGRALLGTVRARPRSGGAATSAFSSKPGPADAGL